MWRLVIFACLLVGGSASAQLLNIARYSNVAQIAESVFDNGGAPWNILTQIGAENYDLGGPNVAFSVWSTPACGAVAGTYRADSVNFYQPGTGSFANRIGCTKVNDYFKYTVNLPTGSVGPFQFSLVASNANALGIVNVSIDNSSIGDLQVSNTGGGASYGTTTSANFPLAVGNHTVKLKVVGGDASGFGPDIAAFQVSQVSSSGNPTPPAGAQAAGYTTLAFNYDASLPQFANPATYMECLGASSPIFYQGRGGYSGVCGNLTITQDQGFTVLDAQWQPGFRTGNTNNDYVAFQTPSTANGNPVLNSNSFPYAYFEIEFRTAPLGTQSSSDFISSFWTWPATDSTFGTVEYDYIEGGRSDPQNYDGGAWHNWGDGECSAPSGRGCGDIWDFADGGAPGVVPGYDANAYHKWAGRLAAVSGANTVQVCNYVDGAARSGSAGPCATIPLGASSPQQRNNIIVTNGVGNNSTNQTINMYIKTIRVWSCANWATQLCFVGSLPPT